MRLFLAIPLPEPALARLRVVLAGLHGRDLKVVRPDGLHLTLLFLGERDEAEAGRIARLLEAPQLAVPRIAASFGGLGQFPPRGSPRVIYTPVREGAREIVALQQALVGVLQGGGIRLEEEGRAFTPHLTLARRGGGPPELNGLEDLLDFEAPFTADRLVLFQSLLKPAGAEYRALKNVTLKQGRRMRAVDLIVKKRDGGELSREEIEFLIDGYVRGQVPDYQLSSLAMAVFFRGMSFEETGFLTRAMIASGDSIDLSSVPGPLVDKHSTGGVGDKVSLVLAPLAAACGCVVPMMSGRALGHTGGTLDKLESIPGYRTDLDVERFREVLQSCGFAMTGQSERIVPADRLLYALRDVTGTVESIPLITASIMSKKFAEGAQALVFDVKCGSGAFMKSREQARALAVSLARTGASLGRRVRAVISDMDQPLGRMVGNFLEVRECAEVLQGRGPEDLRQLTLRLTAHMLVLGGLAPDVAKAEAMGAQRLADGSAWRRFLDNVKAQGGRAETLLDPDQGPRAPRTLALCAGASGYLVRLEAYRFGLASGLLGAGRSRKEDPVWPEVGIEILKVAGDRVREGEELCLLHGRDAQRLEEARSLLEAAVTVAGQAPPPRQLVLEEIDADALGKD